MTCKLRGDTPSQLLRLRVIRNRLSGHPADDEPDRARLVGEVVAGKATIVT